MDPAEAPIVLPEGYPSGYEVDVVLSDGATAHVRPIRPDDAERLVAFHARQSPQSIYYRYFSPRPRLSDKEVERLTTVDFQDRMALIALRGDEMIGVARYDRWRHLSEAEVAFFVDDANHGRGLATVLLEHLAVRAREVGITGFTATVLPENRKMIGVFTAAGFEASTRFADGLVEVRLGIVPTPEGLAAIEERASRAAAEAVRRLLSPRAVAVIGASNRPASLGEQLFTNLQRSRFQGPVWPVNPNVEHVGTTPAVGSILDIQEPVDLAVVVVPAEHVPAVVEECARKQVYGVVVLSAGFAEAGPEGEALEAEVLHVARSWGIRLVGPNCLGIVNNDPEVRLHATFARVPRRPGRVALLSESGMVGAAIAAQADQVGIGLSSFVALGNRADVSVNDLLRYWESDDHTDVVCLYIESFGNARHFSRAARRLSRAKPVVAVKSGISSDPTGRALLRQTGVIQVPTLRALLEATRLLVHQPLPVGRRVAVLGNAGGSHVIAADAARWADLELAEVRGEDLANPMDLGIRATGADFEAAAAALAAEEEVDAILVLYAPSLGGSPQEVRAALDAARARVPDVPIAACFYGPDLASGADEPPGRVPVYDAVDAAAQALGRLADYAAWRAEPEGEPLALAPEVVGAAAEVVRNAVARGAGPLSGEELGSLLSAVGLDRVATRDVTTEDEAVEAASDIGYPVVLKAVRRSPMAKTVALGLALDLADEAGLRSAWQRMCESLGPAALPAVVQPMVNGGSDVAIAVEDHPEVGPVLSLGPGGASAALDPAVDLRVLPVTDLDAERLVERSRLAPMLDEATRAHLRSVILRVSALVEEVPEITSLRANPVIVGPEGARLTDVSVEVAALDRTPLPPLRRVEEG
ncbi:MAG: GNAT family N-acetyltransferase [Acidimicrobiia bacterium]